MVNDLFLGYAIQHFIISVLLPFGLSRLQTHIICLYSLNKQFTKPNSTQAQDKRISRIQDLKDNIGILYLGQHLFIRLRLFVSRGHPRHVQGYSTNQLQSWDQTFPANSVLCPSFLGYMQLVFFTKLQATRYLRNIIIQIHRMKKIFFISVLSLALENLIKINHVC